MIKFLIGGSPCTHWSIAQSNNREKEPQGLGWELFRNFLIAKERFKPDFFLYENNKSAAKPIKEQISIELDVPLQYINSALVSAQNRERFYAHNFGDVPLPENRGILLQDILESGASWTEKSYALTTRCMGAIPEDTLKRRRHTMVAETPCVIYQSPRGFNKGGLKHGKAPTLTASKYQDNNFVVEGATSCLRYERTEIGKALRKQYESGEIEHGFNEHRALCSRPDGKTNTLTTVHKDNMICTPVRIASINKGGQGERIYSPNGKSICLSANGGGWGAKTGLYACPISHTIKNKPIYEVKNGLIEINGNIYPIKLSDGFYIIRKLTVTECCRLQTMPDNYCRVVSASQGYKGLGNGWTAEVIIHLLSHALRNVPKTEKIIVLSLYDGIGTGRYCFDKLGYNNVTYYAYEIDKYAIQVALSNYPDIIECGNAFGVCRDDWFMERAVKTWDRFYLKIS